ncbi:hypothetical protein HQQ80_07335 [Microbacteriaceae bacterium VKM Ac-2855]|nr:hypothetical protein [Microbacteriaceae bacterium VKM Ac-2855]
MLWVVEFRKHLPIFAAIYAVTIVTGAAALLFPDVVVLGVIQALGGLLCWSAAVIYAASVILRYLSLGRDLLLQIGTVSRWRIVWMKAAVLGAYLFGLHVVSLAFLFKKTSDAAGDQFGSVLAYLIGGKLLSIAVFLVAVVLVATLVKMLRTKAAVVTGFSVLVVAVVIGQAILLWQTGAPDTAHFFIGVGGDFFTVNLYANILPIILTDASAGFLPNIWVTSVLLNTALAAMYFLIWAVVTRVSRVNFLSL